MSVVAAATWRTPDATKYPTYPVYYCAFFYDYSMDLATASAFAAKLNSSGDFDAVCNSTAGGGSNATNDTAYLTLLGNVYTETWMDRDNGDNIGTAVGKITVYLNDWINTTYTADLLTVAATYNRRLTSSSNFSNSSNSSNISSFFNSGVASGVEAENTETFAPTGLPTSWPTGAPTSTPTVAPTMAPRGVPLSSLCVFKKRKRPRLGVGVANRAKTNRRKKNRRSPRRLRRRSRRCRRPPCRRWR